MLSAEYHWKGTLHYPLSYHFQLTYLLSRLRSAPRDRICIFVATSLKSLHFQQLIQWFLVILCFGEVKKRIEKKLFVLKTELWDPDHLT